MKPAQSRNISNFQNAKIPYGAHTIERESTKDWRPYKARG